MTFPAMSKLPNCYKLFCRLEVERNQIKMKQGRKEISCSTFLVWYERILGCLIRVLTSAGYL